MLEPIIIPQLITTNCFRFENTWLRDPIRQKIMEVKWHLNQDKSLQKKLMLCSECRRSGEKKLLVLLKQYQSKQGNYKSYKGSNGCCVCQDISRGIQKVIRNLHAVGGVLETKIEAMVA